MSREAAGNAQAIYILPPRMIAVGTLGLSAAAMIN